MLHIKYESSGPCGFGEEDFLCFSQCMSMGANDSPGPHCNIQNMKALGLVVLDKKIFYVFPMTPPGQGPYGPQGHGWQDL